MASGRDFLCLAALLCLASVQARRLPSRHLSQQPTTGPTPADCPSVCQCSKKGTVNCEGKHLTSIPEGIPATVVALYLDHNNIVTLPEGALADFEHLSKVFLSNNQIQTLSPGAFRNLPLLKEIDLTTNKIEQLPAGVFQEVNSLSLINLSANKMTAVPDLGNLPGLNKLYLGSNKIQNATFPASYSNVTGLTSIVLSTNNVTKVTNDTFRALANCTVRRLDLTGNGLQSVSPGALIPLSFLQSLKIGVNPLDGVQLQNVLSALSTSTNLESLDIHDIRLGGTLSSLSFSSQSLKTLIFKNNKMRIIPEGAFAYLPKLVLLDLTNCQIQTVKDNAFSKLPELQTLFLNQNMDISAIPKNLPKSLLKLYLQFNKVEILQNGDFSNLVQLQELYLSNNNIDRVFEDSFTGLMNLRILHLQNNRMSYIPKKLFAPLPSLLTLNLKNNVLKSLKLNPGAMGSLGALTSLDMSSNQCSYIPFDYFSDLTSLQNLNLENNNLGGLMASDDEGRLLRSMGKLWTLNLANNNLHYIYDAQFRNLFELKHLNLKNNRLSTWGPNLFYTPGGSRKSLQVLDLSSNQIALVNATSVRDLQQLKTLNLSLNPFACTCDLRWFSTWLNTTSVNVVNKSTYKCNSPPSWNGKLLSDFGPDKIDCTDYTKFYIAGAILGTLIVALVISLILYRQRWFIWLRFYRMRKAIRRSCCSAQRRRDGYAEIVGRNAHRNYDFYVIAAEEDAPWVCQNLLPMLDNGPTLEDKDVKYQGKFSLYFEERDDIPGESKIGNFDSSMPVCQAALIVLTKHLSDDAWCRFLLDRAYMLQVDGLLDSIQIIKVGKVSDNRIPKLLHKDMERNKFKSWPDKETVERDFVDDLNDVLGRGGEQNQNQEQVGDPGDHEDHEGHEAQIA